MSDKQSLSVNDAQPVLGGVGYEGPKANPPAMIKIIVEKVSLIDNSVNDCYDRQEIIRTDCLTDMQIVRLAKTIMGWTGVVCRREDMGDIIRLKQPNTTLALDIEIQHM